MAMLDTRNEEIMLDTRNEEMPQVLQDRIDAVLNAFLAGHPLRVDSNRALARSCIVRSTRIWAESFQNVEGALNELDVALKLIR